MSETDEAVSAARGTLDRVQGRALDVPRPRRRRPNALVQRVAAIGAANLALLVAAVVVGFVMPIGMFGALAVMLAMLATTLLIALAPVKGPPPPEKLRDASIRQLPRQTGYWLDAQRPALPAPAQGLVDRIGVRLDALTPQLATLADDAPAAAEIRKLVGEQLPDFVRDYQQVPANLRATARNGRTPDAQLVDGLKLIERELGEMSESLAQGNLDQLETRGRFLEIKYREGGE